MGHWPVSALPSKRRARLNTCHSRPVRARRTRYQWIFVYVFCVTIPSQVRRRQISSTSSSRSGRASLVSSVRAIHISRTSVSGQAAEQVVCVQKVAGASPDRWRQCVKEDPFWSVRQCLGFLCHPPITRPAVCGRSRSTSLDSAFLQRRAALPIIETQKSPCERCETGLFPGKSDVAVWIDCRESIVFLFVFWLFCVLFFP